MIATLNCEFAKLTEWLYANKLTINMSKSHYMVFNRSRRKINKGNILLDTTILSQVTFTKFLGVILDDKLKWTHHISYIKIKFLKVWMGIILKARKVLKLFICDSISNILFGNLGECVWHTSTTTYYNTKNVRIITFSSYCSHTTILFKHLNVLPLKKLGFLRI